MSRYSPTRGPQGVVYQAGLDMRVRGQPRPYETTRGPYRAVVIETYVSDSDGRSDLGFAVEADVVLVRSGAKLTRVPIMSRIGRNDASPWVPRKTTRTLSNNQPLNIDAVLSRRGTFLGLATVLDDVDGDVVLVDFLEGDFRFPIVTGAYPHSQSRREVIEGVGWEEGNGGSERGTPHDQEHYLRHAGVELRVSDAGDVLLDTVGATDDKVDEDPASGRGQVRIRVKESERFTVEMDGVDVLEVWKDGGQVRVDLGEGADERIVLGDSFRTFYNTEIDKVNTFWSAKFNTHTHTVPMGGSTGVPAAPQVDTLSSMGTALLSDLAKAKK